MASSSSSSPSKEAAGISGLDLDDAANGWEYDVFLSFHGKDTRNDFVACLHMFLSDLKGYRIFKDDEELERGKSISPELVNKINESRIAVIVFSENYASSSWCLDELVEILECRKNKKQIVLPLFYDVKPSDVRNQTGKFGEAFTHKHEGIRTADELERWRTALKETAGISGLELQDAANGNWPKFFQEIGQEISPILPPRTLKVAEYEVGIDSRASELIMLLNDSSKDKLFVGIWGTGGIGKTTVAKAVFNGILNKFERSCFLHNVREESAKHGLNKLQEELLRQILKDNAIRIPHIDEGFKAIEQRLQNKKILIVLDDVDDENQLKHLAGIGKNWFGPGSRIIITTRNEWLLKKNDVKICKAKLLDDREAFELFSWHAFKQNSPETEFLQLSNRVKKYAQGLPLALQVLGSLLCRKSKEVWESELRLLKKNHPKEIYDVLKISYDSLREHEKAIFLDIACFFKGWDEKSATDFFKSCGMEPASGIEGLIQKSLITISKDNKLWMHDLIQEMGQEIVRKESIYPAKRSRLWSYEDIREVFDSDTEPKKIEGIMLTEVSEEGLIVDLDVLVRMKKLRILIISTDVKLIGCPEFLPKQLRCFKWKGYPEEYLPMLPKSLVQLELSYSYINKIPLDKNVHTNLKVIDFSFCKNLVETLNFYELPCLEKLDLRWCRSVVAVEFHHMMKKLRFINLHYCKNLKKIPDLSQLSCLEKLYLQGCQMVESLPSNIGEMKGLKTLYLSGTIIKNLPSSIEHLKGLEELDFRNCQMLESLPSNIGEMKGLKKFVLSKTIIKNLPSSIEHLKGLEELHLRFCEMLESLPSNIGEMNGLKTLYLCKTPIKKLPSSVEHLKGLQELFLNDCKMLKSLPSNIGGMERLRRLWLARSGIKKLPSSFAQLTNLKGLDCDNCNLDEESILNLPHSLRDLNLSRNSFASLPASFTQLTNLDYLRLDGCSSLQTLESLPSSIHRVLARSCESLERYSIPTSESNLLGREWYFTGSYKLVEKHENNKPNVYSESQLQDIGESCIILPGSEIPSWFTHIGVCETASEDPSLCLWVDVPNSVCLKVDPNPTSERRDIGEVFVRDPESICNKLKGISVCAVIGIDPQYVMLNFSLRINGFNASPFYRNNWDDEATSYRNNWESSDHVMLSHITNPSLWNNSDTRLLRNSDASYIKISFSVKRWLFSDYKVAKEINIPVKKWGIHLHMDPPAPTQVYREQLSASDKLLTYKRKRKRTPEDC